ncbi:MAG: beta strand repeat-containing protein [Nitrososphaeraceae archaeon]
MDYIINKTDPINGTFTIKPYTTNGPNVPNAAVPLESHAVSANTSLILLGKGMYQFGEIIAENFVHMLEHFASPIQPAYPIQGQIWYKNDTKQLFVYDGTSFSDAIIVNGRLTTNLDINNNRIVNVVDPIDAQDVATKGYIDALSSVYVSLSGSTMQLNSNLTFNGGEILGLPNTPSIGTSATSKNYVDVTASTLVSIAGDIMTGTLTMSNSGHIMLPTPDGGFLTNDDVVNKLYVDNMVSSSDITVLKTGDTMSGRLLINGNALYKGVDIPISLVDIDANTITLTGGDYTIDFFIGIKFLATLTATSGYQSIDIGGTTVGGDATGLANDATVYTASVSIDGVATAISVVGSTAQTFTDLLNEINTDLAAAGTITISGGNLKITSATTGIASLVAITDTDLFATLAGYVDILTAIPGYGVFEDMLITLSSTYNAGPNTTTITTVESLTNPNATGTLSKLSGLQLINNAETVLDGDFSLIGTHTVSMGNNRIMDIDTPIDATDAANKSYVDSAVAASVDGTLSSATFVDNTLTLTSTTGSPITVSNIAEQEHIHITSDSMYDVKAGINYNSMFRELFADNISTYPAIPLQQVISSIDNVLYQLNNRPNDRHVYTISTNSVITFSAPLASDLTIVDISPATSGIQDVTFSVAKSGGDATGLANDATTYTASISVDGVAKAISVVGSAAQTFTTLLAEINIDLAAAGTIAISGGNLRVTSATTGASSTVAITDTDLFSTLTNYSAVGSAVNGVKDFVVAGGGDYTTTFKTGISFTISGDTGVTGVVNLQTLSSVYDAPDTIITVVDNINPSIVGDGNIDRLYGALELSGVLTAKYTAGCKINLSGNSNGASNADYVLSNVSANSGLTATYLYANSTTPFPAATGANGTILSYSIVTPFNYTTETNKLFVFNQGAKQYNGTRGKAFITFDVINNKLVEWYPTNLSAGSYSFDLTADGGAPQTIGVTVAYPSYAVAGVDTTNNSWTVTTAPLGYYKQFSLIEVVSNVGLGVSVLYTIKKVVENGTTITLYTHEDISVDADVSGNIVHPYTYTNLITDIQDSINSLYTTNVPSCNIIDGVMIISSGKVGTGSSISISDVTLLAALSTYVSPIVTTTGADYSFKEMGQAYLPSNYIELQTLPIVGDVYELINT